MSFKLPDLPYEYGALAPNVDERTMKIHHTKHHQGYVNKLNNALEGHDDLLEMEIEELLRKINDVPDDIRTAVVNNGGGHANHSLFWKNMTPESKEPSGDIKSAIEKNFGGMNDFKQNFTDAAGSRFGSGWAWLVLKNGKLEIYSTANQDSPLMQGDTPILGLDVWEHAYYLNYQNERAKYIEAWWNIVNWEQVGRNLKDAS